jgi:hypothetical protein
VDTGNSTTRELKLHCSNFAACCFLPPTFPYRTDESYVARNRYTMEFIFLAVKVPFYCNVMTITSGLFPSLKTLPSIIGSYNSMLLIKVGILHSSSLFERLIISLIDCEPVLAVVALLGTTFRHSWDLDSIPRSMRRLRAFLPSGASGQADKLGSYLNRRSLRQGTNRTFIEVTRQIDVVLEHLEEEEWTRGIQPHEN